MFNRLGIGARLFIAFLGITALSLSSGVASWFILRGVSQAQIRMSADALPAVAATQRTADASARLVSAAPTLTSAKDEVSRARHEAELSALALEIRKSVADARLSSLDGRTVAKLSDTVDLLVSNLSAQNRLVKERLELQRNFSRRAEQTIAAATSIVDLSETLVSNASAGASAVIANLYGLIDDPARHADAYNALDRLIEEDIYLLDRTWELRLRSSQIGLLTNRLTRAIDRNEVVEIANGYQQHLRVVRRRVASIDDPVRREQAAGFLQMLGASTGASPSSTSLFGGKLRLIAIGDELDQVAKDNRNLSDQVSRVARNMLLSSENFARETASQANRAVNTGLYVLVLSSLIAILISGLIVWLYVERSVVRRLANLAGAMRRLTNGDLTVEVEEEGTHELKALSTAVRVFRDESKQRRALEIEREKTNEELRRHREELQDLVGERTQQWQDANILLQREVVQHTQAREKAESASRAKSEFLATMSHEIRTPMTGMLGMVRILNESTLTKEQKKQLSIAASSGEALLGILNSILDYSKIESGKSGIDSVTFSVRETLSGVVDLMRPAAAEKNLELTLSCDRLIWSRHDGDAGKLRQIVFNLVSNAIKFTESGKIAVAARRLDADSKVQRIEISVTDTGIGISSEDQERVFESFTQSEASITRRYGGTGLGLAISRRFAEILGGTLRVRSPGKGSVFTLTLPLPRGSSQPRRGSHGKTGGNGGRPGLHILVVEDDSATRIVARTFLEKLGHRVTTAKDGYSGLDLAVKEMPDLVVMDIGLPGIDGPETARRLRKLEGAGDLPIVAMSAHVFKDDVERHLSTGMDGYVGKPLTPQMLERAISQATAGRKTGPPPSQLDRVSFDTDLGALGGHTMLRILDVAEATLPHRFSIMRKHVAEKSIHEIPSLAHATRSSAASAGFEALFESAGRLEIAASANDLKAVNRHLTACETNYRLAMAEARSLIVADAPMAQVKVVANR